MYGKVNVKWSKVEQDAFRRIKRIVAQDTLLAYTYFNEEFKIHTDASYSQLGAVISHKSKPIALCVRKLTDAQERHTVTGKYLLRIVETLEDFRTILLGQRLRIYTDH